ncbi:hypothetical protein [Hymenobacter negativus]|uniref:Uncharacterized protein n=1 Tax=Hymenobacter negativus TaxID=2795026 RepID=A0ABS0Q5Y3_9BACT|nr:hypothetical protein [Hymenobacter negativus]MBH8557778.1 hypothetical protein [Hymenobacter negativus]
MNTTTYPAGPGGAGKYFWTGIPLFGHTAIFGTSIQYKLLFFQFFLKPYCMPFNGSESRAIDPNKASEWTKSFREKHPGEIIAHFFGRDILTDILNQEGCQGIRFYYGTDGGVPQLIAVGADSDENDQLGENRIVADEACGCPDRCSQPNILNS